MVTRYELVQELLNNKEYRSNTEHFLSTFLREHKGIEKEWLEYLEESKINTMILSSEDILNRMESDNYGLWDDALNEIYQFLTYRIVLNDVYLLKATEVEQCKYYIEKLKEL